MQSAFNPFKTSGPYEMAEDDAADGFELEPSENSMDHPPAQMMSSSGGQTIAYPPFTAAPRPAQN